MPEWWDAKIGTEGGKGVFSHSHSRRRIGRGGRVIFDRHLSLNKIPNESAHDKWRYDQRDDIGDQEKIDPYDS